MLGNFILGWGLCLHKIMASPQSHPFFTEYHFRQELELLFIECSLSTSHHASSHLILKNPWEGGLAVTMSQMRKQR